MSKQKKRQPIQAAAAPKEKKPLADGPYLAYFLLAFALAFALYVRVRLLGLPLERDEGEYAYMGQLILQGIPPYTEAFNMKLPGTYYMYALFMGLFGESIEGIHLGLLITNVVSIALLYFIGKKIVNPMVGAIAAVSYAILTAAMEIYGLAAHATHFNVLFGLGGFLTLLFALENEKIKWVAASGLLFGLSFVMKQQAVFLVIFGGIVLLINELKRSPRALKTSTARLAVFALAVAIPYLCVVLVALSTGSFDQFWHWTVEYARQYAGVKDWDLPARQFADTFKAITKGVWGFWVLGLLGVVALFFTSLDGRKRLILMLFAVFSFLCVCPGLYFRNHYFIVFLPALSLLVGVTIQFLRERATKLKMPALQFFSIVLFALAVAVSFYSQRKHFFTYSVVEAGIMQYGSNPFAQSLDIAKFIQKNTTPADRIAVMGSEPQIYFYSKRKSASGILYAYPLMENQPYSLEMQRTMMADIERARPKYIVMVKSPYSWLIRPESNRLILDWYTRYSSAHYNLVGVADLVGPGNTQYVWGPTAPQYGVHGKTSVFVLERRD